MKLNNQKLILALLTPDSVRERCNEILQIAEAGTLEHFQFHAENLEITTQCVLQEIGEGYPDGRVPFHSRWRHFEFGDRNLWRDLFDELSGISGAERARRRIDLAVVSVLLDAGAGPDWQYKDRETGLVCGRSEGLALASLRLIQSGILSQHGKADPIRVDAACLSTLTSANLAEVFQVTVTNPLVGLEARTSLLNRLGDKLSVSVDIFGRDGDIRPGNLFDYLVARQDGSTLKASEILIALLVEIGSIWPEGESINGWSIGDVGFHKSIVRDDITNGILPFHKLSQWMAYSLIEPLNEAKIDVIDLDSLTGLAEYRNGGLFIDTKVLSLKNNLDANIVHLPKSELVVEWRALTVALLDKVAASVRQHMGKDATSLPLASVLQGGTWAAGRRVAKQLRPDGESPLRINSTGTIF